MDVAEYIKRKQKEQNMQNQQAPQENINQNKKNIKTQGNQTQQSTQGQNNQKAPQGQNQQNNVNPQAAFGKYSKMNEEQLMQELFKAGSVSSGKISPEALDNFYKSISARLSPEQAARMKDLISQLKRS